MSVVYFVRIGKFIKIGFTTNIKIRLRNFRSTTAEQIETLLTIPGDRKLESRLHKLFHNSRRRNEFFHYDDLVVIFINIAKQHSPAARVRPD